MWLFITNNNNNNNNSPVRLQQDGINRGDMWSQSYLQCQPRSVLVFLDVHRYVVRLTHPDKPLTVQTSAVHQHTTYQLTVHCRINHSISPATRDDVNTCTLWVFTGYKQIPKVPRYLPVLTFGQIFQVNTYYGKYAVNTSPGIYRDSNLHLALRCSIHRLMCKC